MSLYALEILSREKTADVNAGFKNQNIAKLMITIKFRAGASTGLAKITETVQVYVLRRVTETRRIIRSL